MKILEKKNGERFVALMIGPRLPILTHVLLQICLIEKEIMFR